MNRTKTKVVNKVKCLNCEEERKKADQSRKYAHELKNIFITISTVVNSEMESPHQFFSSVSTPSISSIHVADSGDVSPFIMEGRRPRAQRSNNNTNNNNNTDSPIYFLKTLCDYGKTLIKELNDMGKDYTNTKNELEPFNISKAIDFCVDMFDTKRKYKKKKKNIQIYSDINFSYDKDIKSISENGFKMVLINLLTNSYKFTTKGKIIVRAVSMPKEKKIRIMVKDSGKGFNPNEFKKNGCFYVYEKNQELNADGSGLGLSIVSEILTKFKIKLDCISSAEKGGSLFYFDLDDTYPYYDEINPKVLMTDSLSQIIKDINQGKKDNEFSNNKNTYNFKDNIFNAKKMKNINKNENEKEINNNTFNNTINNNIINNNINNNKINNYNDTNENLNIINNNNIKASSKSNSSNVKINFNNNNNKQRFSFMMTENVNVSPKFGENKNNERKVLDSKNNLNVNIYNLNNATLFSFDKSSDKKRKNSAANNEPKNNNPNYINNKHNSNKNNNNLITTPNKKKIDRFLSLQKPNIKRDSTTSKSGKPSMLKQIIEDSNNNKIKSYYNSSKKVKVMNFFNKKGKGKNIEDSFNTINENEDSEELIIDNNIIKKIKDEKKKKIKNYKKLLDQNFNKTKFYLFELKKIFKKNEIYVHLIQQKKKKCITEPSSEVSSAKKLKHKKSFYNDLNKVYIIICDDEEFVARSARELIINYYIKKGKEPHVYYTPNGIECLYLMYKLSIIENRKIEYILMDLEMPYLNGIRTCNIIKSIKEANVPVFILSGDEPNDCKADGCCNKPLNEIDIINKLDKKN